MVNPKGKLQRFILTTLGTGKKGKTRSEIEAAYAEYLGSSPKAPGTYQALKHLASIGLVESAIGTPTGSRGRTPHVYSLTEAGAEARKAIRKQDRAA